MTKNVLIGIFIKKDKILSFLGFIKNKFNLPLDKIFIYEINGNKEEYLLTFKTNNKKKYLQAIKYSTVLHVKNGCIFSINALNEYITEKNGIKSNEYIVDWENLANKILITNNGELKVYPVKKIEDKNIFFK